MSMFGLASVAMARKEAMKQQLDEMARWIETQLSDIGLEAQPLPEKFSLNVEVKGQPLAVQPHAFCGPDIAMARVVRVDGGDYVQVLNAVFFPAEHCTLPIFGCEILAFRHGLHLFVLDAFPTNQSSLANSLSQTQAVLHQGLRERLTMAPTPTWGKEVFSKDVILLKPPAKSDVGLDDVSDSLRHLVEAWCAAHQEGAHADSPVQTAKILEQRKRYLFHHAHDEPAGPFLQRLAGEAWAQDFIFSFLFPQWLCEGDRLWPWLSAETLLPTTSVSSPSLPLPRSAA